MIKYCSLGAERAKPLANCHKEILRLLSLNMLTEDENDVVEKNDEVIEPSDKGGDAEMQSVAKTPDYMQQIPSEDGSDLISRADAIEAVKHSTAYMHDDLYEAIFRIPSAETTGALDDAIAKYVADGLMELPSAERVGEWEHTITWQPYCSNCEYVFDEDEEYSPFWKFCPMCGARMENTK